MGDSAPFYVKFLTPVKEERQGLSYLVTDLRPEMDLENLTSQIIAAAIHVHSILGPGLLESVYEEALAIEIEKRGLSIERQKAIPVFYEGKKMEVGFRADLIVERKVLVEVKSTDGVSKVFKKITLNYLHLTSLRVGLLINFNEELLKNGITRLVNNKLG